MDDLQFDKAEYSGPSAIGPCANCSKPIEATYWHANGQNVCDQCANSLRQVQQAPGQSVVAQGALYAFGAAIACAIGYAAILIITKYELALISIAVGWIVGKAARIGAGGRGGRPVQIVAVIATYIAISGSLFFQILYAYFSEGKMVANLFNYLWLFILSMGKPFFELQEGFGGLLGLAILFFGLQQAWQQTKGLNIELAGPYTPGTVQQS